MEGSGSPVTTFGDCPDPSPEPEATPPSTAGDLRLTPTGFGFAPGGRRILDVESVQEQLRAKEEEVRHLREQLRRAEEERYGPQVRTPLCIVIPMGGLDAAFAEAGFRYPRPLVNVVGRPMLLWLLDRLAILPSDLLLFAVPAVMEKQYGVSKLLAREFPLMQMRVVTLPFETRGWVETMLAVARQMTAKELRRPLASLDCSTIYHSVDLLEKCRALPTGVGASVYFEVESAAKLSAMGAAAAQFSYLLLDEGGSITGMQEKTVVSHFANTGAYIFGTGRQFRTAAEALLESPEECMNTGLYASTLISKMVARGDRMMGLQVSLNDFAIVSTPTQLQSFIFRVSSGQVPMQHKMRFCFDLEATLVTEPPSGDLSLCEAIPQAVALVRQLHDAGHCIIVTTSRGMETGHGTDSAIASVGAATFQLLKKLDIPYDELHFGKPHAHVYIDSRSLNGQADLLRDLGWSVATPATGDALDGAIDARSFNLVRGAGKSHVIKSSTPEVLRGECHWYRSIPPGLKDFFPAPLHIDEPEDLTNPDAVSSITMAKVSGTTFSHLVTSHLLMKAWVRRLVQVLHKIHTEPFPEGSEEEPATHQELCSNYAGKVAKRIKKHSELYNQLGRQMGIDMEKMGSTIVNFLEDFEQSEHASRASYIHGDPVFSNIIRTSDDKLVLIDMRGELGKRLTTQGDIHYDLSKVYQSLCGYDFMLLDQSLDESTSQILDGLRAVFWDEVGKLYPDISHRNVRLHTACHFFAIVPLHEVQSRMARYLRTSISMLHVEGLL